MIYKILKTIKEFGTEPVFLNNGILTNTNHGIVLYNAKFEVIWKKTNCHFTGFLNEEELLCSNSIWEKDKQFTAILDVNTGAVKEIFYSDKISIALLYRYLFGEVVKADSTSVKRSYFFSDKAGKHLKEVNEETMFGGYHIYETDYIYSTEKNISLLSKIEKNTLNRIWQLNLNSLKSQVPSWKDEEEEITVQSKIEKWNDSILFIAGTYNVPYLISINIESGNINWISDHNPLAFHFFTKDGFAYNHGANYLNKINLLTGQGIKIDISEQSNLYNIRGSYSSLLCDNYFLPAEFEKLKFGLLNIDTLQYEFVHQFTRGKDMAKEVWQIYPPRYHHGRIYVLDSSHALHIFEKENV